MEELLEDLALTKDYALRFLEEEQKASRSELCFEFALLNSKEDDTEDDFLKKEMVAERGMFTLSEQDCEAQVREKIASTLKEKYSVIGPNDFELVKVTQKRISILHLSKQTEYNYDVVKKLVGQGLLYIRIKVGFEFVVNENHASNSDSELLQVGAQETSTIPSNSNGTSGIVPGTSDGTSSAGAVRLELQCFPSIVRISSNSNFKLSRA